MNKSDIMKAAELREVFEKFAYSESLKQEPLEELLFGYFEAGAECMRVAAAELLKQVEVVEDLPMLVKRCLTFGIEILPYQLKGVLRQYNQKKIPDDILAKLDKPKLQEYVKGLYLSSCEMAGDWTKGHEILKTLGFNEVERREGHRVFVSLQYEPPVIIDKEGV